MDDNVIKDGIPYPISKADKGENDISSHNSHPLSSSYVHHEPKHFSNFQYSSVSLPHHHFKPRTAGIHSVHYLALLDQIPGARQYIIHHPDFLHELEEALGPPPPFHKIHSLGGNAETCINKVIDNVDPMNEQLNYTLSGMEKNRSKLTLKHENYRELSRLHSKLNHKSINLREFIHELNELATKTKYGALNPNSVTADLINTDLP